MYSDITVFFYAHCADCKNLLNILDVEVPAGKFYQFAPSTSILYILHKIAKSKLCTSPNFSYDGFSLRTNKSVRLLINAGTQGGNKNEQQLPLPSKSNTGISTNPTNTKHVPTTTRKCLRNQHSTRNRERSHWKHRPVSCHLPCRKPNVYKILPKWLASHNGLPRFSFPKRGQQNRDPSSQLYGVSVGSP